MKTLFLVWSIQARLLRSKESKGGADEHENLSKCTAIYVIGLAHNSSSDT